MNRHRHTLIIAILGIAAGYFFVILFAIALFWPVKTIRINNYSDGHPVPVETKTLHPGEKLVYKLDYCKYTDKISNVRRELIDGQIITLQDKDGKLPTGCYVAEIRTVVIPETINPGRYYLSVDIDYKANPIRDTFIGLDTTHYRTEYFDVIAEPQPATALIYGVPTTVYLKPSTPVYPDDGEEEITVINPNPASSSSRPTTTTPPSHPLVGSVFNAVTGLLR